MLMVETCCRFLTAVLVAVDSTADLLSETTGVDRSQYQTLPLGYSKRFAGMEALAGPSAGDPVRFAFWGGIGRHKGVDVLLNALRQVCSQRPGRAALHVLGGFESLAFEDELRALADGLPVTFHGAFDAGQLHASNPHVGVFPSTCIETFGLVLDECFELGLPCITSDLGALPERGQCMGLLETETWDLLTIPSCLIRLTTTTTPAPINCTNATEAGDQEGAEAGEGEEVDQLPICNVTEPAEGEAETQTRRKRFVQRMPVPRQKRELMKVCDTRAVFGVQWTYLNHWNFTLVPEICYCGLDEPALEGHSHRPGDQGNTSFNYYPGDVYDYYAVTLDPWESALESDR